MDNLTNKFKTTFRVDTVWTIMLFLKNIFKFEQSYSLFTITEEIVIVKPSFMIMSTRLLFYYLLYYFTICSYQASKIMLKLDKVAMEFVKFAQTPTVWKFIKKQRFIGILWKSCSVIIYKVAVLGCVIKKLYYDILLWIW